MGILAPAPRRCCQSSRFAVPAERGLLWAWLLCCVLSPMLACRPWGEAVISGEATSGCSGAVCVSGLGCPPPPAAGTQALPPFPSGGGPGMAIRFLVASSRCTGGPLLPGPACRQPCQAMAGLEFPAFWSGVWHRNPTCFVSGISWRAGHVAMRVRRSKVQRAPPGSLAAHTFALDTTGSEQA